MFITFGLQMPIVKVQICVSFMEKYGILEL